MSPIIRILRIVLAVVWYGSIAIMIVLALIFGANWGNPPIPYYVASVSWNGIGQEYEIRQASSGESLHSAEFWGERAKRADRLIHDVSGLMVIRPPNKLWALYYNLAVLLEFGLTMAVIHLLRRLFQSLKAGTPFTHENARRVRNIGLLIFGGTLIMNLVEFAVSNYLDGLVITRGIVIKTDLDLSFSILFLGLVVLAISEFFRHGVELEAERALTV